MYNLTPVINIVFYR